MRRALLALVVALAACGGTATPTTAPPTTVAPVITEAPTTTASTAPSTTTTTVAPTTSTLPEVFAGVLDGAGGASIGDSYYPRLGNSGYDVLDVVLDVDFRGLDDGAFSGVATLLIEPTEPLTSFVLDTGTLSLDEVTIDGTPAGFEEESAEEHRITPVGQLEDAFEVVIAYDGVPEPKPDSAIPFGVGLRPAADSWYAVSEPSGATTWFPANDHPLDKATYTVRLTVQEGFVGISGGLLTSIEPADGGGSTYTWSSEFTMTSYLVPLAVGDFDRIERGLVEGILVRDYVDPDVDPPLLEDLDRVPEALEWMISVFGPYPFEAYGTIALDTDFGGALETQTMSTHGPSALGMPVLVHELAHQWFGNSVSVADWSDIWLNEGFATYAEWLWIEHDRGRTLYDAVTASMYEAYRQLPPPGNPRPDDLFNGGVYVGGASVLHALRVEVGDDAFFEILRSWAAEQAYANGTTGEFVELVNRIAGRDLTEFLEVWLAGDGPAHVPLP